MERTTPLVSESEALADARSFSVLAAFDATYRPYVARMKAVNPNLLLFVYMNATFTWQDNLPESYYAHDVFGRRVSPYRWLTTYLLEPSSAGAIVYQQKRAANLLALSGYDGIYLDVLGPASISTAYVTSEPVNPLTGKVYTAGEWLKGTTKIAAQVRTYVGRPVIGNGLQNGRPYFDATAPTEQLLDSAMEGAVPEGWLRGAQTPLTAYPSEATWKQDVDMLVDAGARGVSIGTVTKVYSEGTLAQKDAWLKFAVASFLLGNDGRHWFFFTYELGDNTVPKKWTNLFLGTPLGPYAKTDGVYQRAFSKGKALVNPTTSTYTVPLGGAYTTLTGATVTSVTLAPKTAEIVRLL